jgi:hypothetical protein
MNPKPSVTILCSVLFALVSFCVALAQSQYGSFPNNLDIRLSRSEQEATLLADFSYIDPGGKRWTVPKGVKLDGASIPRILWTPVGSPWTGQYKEASVIHDYLCEKKTAHWKDVHRLFYTGMLANGVGIIQANIMYATVYRFGPRWNFRYVPKCPGCLAVPYEVSEYTPTFRDKEFAALKKSAEMGRPLEEIEAQADAQFNDEVESKKLGTPVLNP